MDYNKSPSFQNLYKLLLSLAFVPANDVWTLWESVIEPEIHAMLLQITGPMDRFIDYFLDTYLGKIGRSGFRSTPLIHPKTWSQFNQVLEDSPTTNNAAEAWNGAWTSSVQTNASLWTVIEAFKREEAISITKWKEDIELMCSKNARSPMHLKMQNAV